MSFQIGAFFPTRDMPADHVAIRDWAQAAEAIGFDFVEVSDHVLGADREALPNFEGPYDVDDSFHETFVTMAYIAAVTERVGLASGVLILPQRQTALVAKQAAQLDVVSGGRLRLGIGVGWNPVEYEALGQD
jgi:alkanesulfonate monooxygenase SsuD/methylene tetrahydromethanopterin reductase-like flavin-dependent oxidoreductase (luciferase family)